MENPFAVLGVDKGAPEADVKRAYRALARRWHPDRFAEGPERLWAEQRMIEINIAYHEALACCSGAGEQPAAEDGQQLEDIKQLIGLNQLGAARQALMRVGTRTPEWNYLFAAVLLRLGEYEKAVLYFGIAARQRPENQLYRSAYASAAIIRDRQKVQPLIRKLAQPFLGNRRNAR
ncbi:MAG: J domain-containing protein [Clostridiales bacterium]|nr:J domain-containing protein [Clostridiales bacterium]